MLWLNEASGAADDDWGVADDGRRRRGVEIGAILRPRGLSVLEEQLGDLGTVIDAWLEGAAAPLRTALHRS
jgi:hypothetical protein